MDKGINIKLNRKYLFTMVSLLCLLTAATMLILGKRYFDWFLSIPCYFLVTGVLFYLNAGKIVSAPGNKFMTYYMAMLSGKLMIAVIGITLYLLFVKEQAAIFVIIFFVYYVAFSILETGTLLKINKKNSEK